MNASHFPQLMVLAAGAGLVVLAILFLVFPFRDRPEPERIKPRPGSDNQFARWRLDRDEHTGRHRRAA